MKGKLLLKGISILSAIAITFSGVMAEPVLAEGLRSDIIIATTSNAERKEDDIKFGEIIYNLGSREIKVSEDKESRDADWTFDDNGSFQIYVGDSNPYFPYEVQFKYQDNVVTEWFKDPNDSVVVDGHTFTLKLRDSTKYTRYVLEVGGKEELLYPEKKSFTNESNSVFRLAGAVKRRSRTDGGTLNVDLSQYTPLELSRVRVSGLLAGIDLTNKKVMFFQNPDISNRESIKVKSSEDIIDLSKYERGVNLLVGDDDQLSNNSIKYIININYTYNVNWLKLSIAQKAQDGSESNTPAEFGYWHIGWDKDPETNRLYLRTYVDENELKNKSINNQQSKISLHVNTDSYPLVDENTIYYYKGLLNSEDDLANANDITEQIKMGTFEIREEFLSLTIVKIEGGQIKGFLPISIEIDLLEEGPELDTITMNQSMAGRIMPEVDWGKKYRNGKLLDINLNLSNQLDLTNEYNIKFRMISSGRVANSVILAAYDGEFYNIEEAQASGKADIHVDLFGGVRYTRAYNEPAMFTVFTSTGNVYYIRVKSVYKEEEPSRPPVLSSNTRVQFTGLKDVYGNDIPGYFVNSTADSYGEYNYQTIMVNDSVDLSNVAPTFTKHSRIKLYVSGGTSEEISGESYHDLTSGIIHYTASAENEKNQGNYWLQIIKPSVGERLYLNSLIDENAKTKVINGVIYTTREVMLDRAHEYLHDIIALNMGDAPIDKISAELDSSSLVLDGYWTLKGDKPLSHYEYETDQNLIDMYGYMNTDEQLKNRPVNMVNIRLKKADGIEAGTKISGVLRIKSDNRLLAEIKLSGIIGDPIIVTESIPDAVKYVPYGTVVQNNNKYSWNVPKYSIVKGKLPDGMILKENGEIYGVPKEAGEFNFTVQMVLVGNKNSLSNNNRSSDRKSFTLKVLDNTDINVDGSTDTEYYLRPDTATDGTGKVPNFALISTEENYLMISNGEFAQYKDVYLDGEKLVRGVDYTANSGSTRLTIKAETLKRNGEGLHTLGMEFRDSKIDTSNTSEKRTGEEGNLKRAAQNYRVGKNSVPLNPITPRGTKKTSNINSGGGSSSGRSGGGSLGGRSKGDKKSVSTSFNNNIENIESLPYAITSRPDTEGNWVHDGKNWTLKDLNNNTVYTGWVVKNSRWYYLNDEGILQSGWQYIDGNWYLFHYTDDNILGAMEVGWNNFNGKWYNLSSIDDSTMGRLYFNTITPDGYRVREDGSWNGEDVVNR
jgi:hypothetical protein